MNKCIRIFITCLPILTFDNAVWANDDGPLNLVAIKNVLYTSVADKINKTEFNKLIKQTFFSIPDVLNACIQSVEYHLEYQEKTNICHEFIKQVIAEHNRILDESVPSNTELFQPINANKFYSKDKSYYMAQVVSDTGNLYGVFDKNGRIACLLNCSGNMLAQATCRPDSESNTAFTCEPKNENFDDFYPDRFIIGHREPGSDNLFNFNHKYLSTMQITETLQDHIDSYMHDNHDMKKISETSADFIDCKNFLHKRFTPKTYQYIPAQSVDYDRYAAKITYFNETANQAKEADTVVCEQLSDTYNYIYSMESKFDTANGMISDFISQSHVGNPKTNDRINYVVIEIESLLKKINLDIGYWVDYDGAECTERMVTDVMTDGWGAAHDQTRYIVRCPFYNDYLPTASVSYRFIIDAQKHEEPFVPDGVRFK